MGLCASKGASSADAEQAKADRRNGRKLDAHLNKDKLNDQLVNKLLLLGAGGSGKSTLFKQMINIYGKGFPESERKLYTNIIYNNIIIAMQTLCQQSEKYGGVAAELDDVKRRVDEIKEGEEIDATTGALIKQLWADPQIQKTYGMRSHFQLTDSAQYFFDMIDSVCPAGYVPSEQDVLRSRVPTTGIVENEFLIEGSIFKMYDVGGQRSERKKWIHCFENVTAVLFVCAISAYDQVLYEDDTTNRMQESLTLFDEICNSHWFRDTSMILFLNKRDLFAEKIEKVPLSRYFPEYTGDNTYEQASEFVRQQFEAKSINTSKQVYTHLTCATDTNNISAVFNAVKDIVIKKGLSRAGLM